MLATVKQETSLSRLTKYILLFDRSYAVVGFGEALPPQDLPFLARRGGRAATTREK